jgi:hypothetical protein
MKPRWRQAGCTPAPYRSNPGLIFFEVCRIRLFARSGLGSTITRALAAPGVRRVAVIHPSRTRDFAANQRYAAVRGSAPCPPALKFVAHYAKSASIWTVPSPSTRLRRPLFHHLPVFTSLAARLTVIAKNGARGLKQNLTSVVGKSSWPW